MSADGPRCRCCKHPLTDEISLARQAGPCCWEGRLSPEERAEIETRLPSRAVRPRRLRIRRVPGRHRDDEDAQQPTLFDQDQAPGSGAA